MADLQDSKLTALTADLLRDPNTEAFGIRLLSVDHNVQRD